MTDSPGMGIWLGYDPAETTAFAVARYSINRFQRYIPIRGIVLDALRKEGLYYRPTEKRYNSEGRLQLWDLLSDAWMSTEFAISRFLVPTLAGQGLALFADSDILCRDNIIRLFERGYPGSKAVYCVKHNHDVIDGSVKKGEKIQSNYARKNWSSVMLFNCDHPANKRLTVEMINTLPGRYLHRFCWLEDEEIGELPPEWNYLVGVSKLADKEPSLAHFTLGLPCIPGYENQEYSDEWRQLQPYAVGAL